MGRNSKIVWCDHTFNPWWGCQKVSAGCAHCYAETLAKRTGRDVWGPTVQRRRTSDANWREPYKWDEAARKAGTRARVFCASMADVFEDKPEVVPWRKELWEIVARTPALTWLLLTKRPEHITRMTPLHWGRGEWPDNVWIGTSVEDQAAADRRIPHLLHIPARVRFLSCEPLLGPVDLRRVQFDPQITVAALSGDRTTTNYGTYKTRDSSINWVIVGGESGPKARPMHPDWARSLRDQCRAAQAPFFFKQWGEWRPFSPKVDPMLHMGSPASKLAKWHMEWGLWRAGKAAAGRLLDGREWNEFPQQA